MIRALAFLVAHDLAGMPVSTPDQAGGGFFSGLMVYLPTGGTDSTPTASRLDSLF
jgi:hypothetical protein